MATWPGRTWRSYRALAPWKQIPIALVAGLFALSVASAPFAADVEPIDASGPTTTLPSPEVVAELPTTTTEAPATTAAPTTTVAPTTTAAPATTRVPPTTVRATTTTPATVRATTTVPTGACHPSYVGVCLPVAASDVDCAGGSGNGPEYTSAKRFQVVGDDPYGLDSDNDRIGCES